MGAKEVVQPEFEAALELTSHLLMTLGKPEDFVHQLTSDIRQDRYGSDELPPVRLADPLPEPQEMAA